MEETHVNSLVDQGKETSKGKRDEYSNECGYVSRHLKLSVSIDNDQIYLSKTQECKDNFDMSVFPMLSSSLRNA